MKAWLRHIFIELRDLWWPGQFCGCHPDNWTHDRIVYVKGPRCRNFHPRHYL